MNTHIPMFEGRPVDATAIKVTGASPLDDLEEQVLSIDDCVQMISMFKCVGVHHQVDKATGKLIRIQTLRPIEMALQPLDPEDPTDDGIIRATPPYVQGQIESGADA
jgi:hypothetical protein